MALSLDSLTETGIEINGTYWRVDEVVTNHNTSHTHRILVKGYVGRQTYLDGFKPISQKWIEKEYNPEDSVSLGGMYAYLKTCEEFEGATDC